MSSGKKWNYKAKYEAAIAAAGGTASSIAKASSHQCDQLIGTTASTNIALREISGVAQEATGKMRSLIHIMDQYTDLGRLKFNEMRHQIDLKISDMDLKTQLRRVRDTLVLAEARIAILSETVVDQNEAIRLLQSHEEQVRHQSTLLQEAYLTNLAIGPQPKSDEVASYISRSRDGQYINRHNIPYEDLGNDWESHIFQQTRATSSTKTNGRTEDDASSVSSGEGSISSTAISKPKSPGRPRGFVKSSDITWD